MTGCLVNQLDKVSAIPDPSLVYDPISNKLYERCLAVCYDPEFEELWTLPVANYSIRRVNSTELPKTLAIPYSDLLASKKITASIPSWQKCPQQQFVWDMPQITPLDNLQLPFLNTSFDFKQASEHDSPLAEDQAPGSHTTREEPTVYMDAFSMVVLCNT